VDARPAVDAAALPRVLTPIVDVAAARTLVTARARHLLRLVAPHFNRLPWSL